MAASRDIGEFIRELRNNARISLRQLAQQAGVSNPYLSQIERGLRKPSAEVLQQIANALRVSTPLMYLRAGLLAEREGQGVLAAIAADPDLTDRHKKTLVEIYEAFRRENARSRGDRAAEPTRQEPVAGAEATQGGAPAHSDEPVAPDGPAPSVPSDVPAPSPGPAPSDGPAPSKGRHKGSVVRKTVEKTVRTTVRHVGGRDSQASRDNQGSGDGEASRDNHVARETVRSRRHEQRDQGGPGSRQKEEL